MHQPALPLAAATPGKSIPFIFIIHQSTALISVIGYTPVPPTGSSLAFLGPTGRLNVSPQRAGLIALFVGVFLSRVLNGARRVAITRLMGYEQRADGFDGDLSLKEKENFKAWLHNMN